MINISISKLKEHNVINELEIDGHANYAEYGQDIVCAAVSTLMFTLIASLGEVLKLSSDKYEYQMDDESGYIKLVIHVERISKKELEDVRLVTSVIITGISGAIEDYSDYARITIREV